VGSACGPSRVSSRKNRIVSSCQKMYDTYGSTRQGAGATSSTKPYKITNKFERPQTSTVQQDKMISKQKVDHMNRMHGFAYGSLGFSLTTDQYDFNITLENPERLI
jgi:hypothetical protein